MSDRKRDWEVITGWEKRIAVDFGSIGPNHVRWSDWTYKERDIVARKVHESAGISRDHGPRSKRMEDWAKENAPIMIDFARDNKPMPDWAHAEYREPGVPEYVQVVWQRERPDDPASPADWAYDPPGPWQDQGLVPEWSGRPMETGYDPNAAIAAPAPQEGFTVNDLKWRLAGYLVLPITDIVYPEGKDELLAMVESKNAAVGGWVTMSALEALGSGADFVETVRDAKEIQFVVPGGYNIEKQLVATVKICFRKSNGGAYRPDYTTYEMPVPAKPLVEGRMDPKFGGVATYRTAANGDHIANDGTILSTAESRAKEDVPDWRKFELGRLEDVDGVIVPGPNALPKDEERFGMNRKHTNLHKTRPNHQAPMAADPRIVDTVRGYWQANLNKPGKGENWRRVLIAFGAEPDDGAGPFTVAEALDGEQIWSGWRPIREELERLEASGQPEPDAALEMVAIPDPSGDQARVALREPRDPIEDANRYREAVGLPPVEKSQSEKLRDALVETNEREDVVVKEFNPQTRTLEEIRVTPEEKRRREMVRYHNSPPVQGNYSAADWRAHHGVDPVVAWVEGWGKYIIDPQTRQPLWELDGDFPATEEWEYDKAKDEWTNLDSAPGPIGAGKPVHVDELDSMDEDDLRDLLRRLLERLEG